MSNWSRYEDHLSDNEEETTQRGEDFNKLLSQTGKVNLSASPPNFNSPFRYIELFGNTFKMHLLNFLNTKHVFFIKCIEIKFLHEYIY